MTESTNPLRKYFRQPSIHLRLPSGGKFYPPGTLDLPPNGEIPILPMTAVDEITTRTPDALFNGSAVVDIMHSCVPNIGDPWSIPAVDFNALLAAVRLASYGHEMEVSTTCPKCGTVHPVTVDLRYVLDQIHMPDYDTPTQIGDLAVYFTPMTYRQLNEINRVQYDAFRRLTKLTIHSLAASIGAVKTSTSMVTDVAHIEEFLINAPKAVFDHIRDHAIKLRSATELTPISIQCDNCQHEYKQEFTLDMTNFFATAS